MGERVVSGFFLFCSIFYLISASQLTFGTMGHPRAGFLPIIIGGIATAFSLVFFMQAFMNKAKEKGTTIPVGFKKLLMIIGAILIYIIVLDLLGYMISTFLLLFAILKITEVKGWTLPLVIAGSSSVGLFLLFEILLKIYLP